MPQKAMTYVRKVGALGALWALALGGPAFANDQPEILNWGPLIPVLSTMEFSRQVTEIVERSSGAREPNAPGGMIGVSPPSDTRTPGSSAGLSYRYDSARTQQNLRSFIARTPTEAGRAQLEQMFAAQPTLMDDIRVGIQSYGLDSHDVADAYVMWWINSWLIANKRDEDPDLATVAKVKEQVRAAFAATPDLAKTSDAERQEYAEALLLHATMQAAAFEQWKNDPNMLAQLVQAAQTGAKASGLDLSLMTLTANGFVPRKGADASGAGGSSTDETVRNARAPDGKGEREVARFV